MYNEQYISDESQWGNSLPSLKDVIDDILIEKEADDSIFRNASRTHLKAIAIRGLRNLQYKMKDNVRAISFTVPENLTVPLPMDYEQYLRVSILDGCDVIPIQVNTTAPSRVATYLQQCGGEFIFDCNGELYEVNSDLKCRHGNCVNECQDGCKPCCVCEDKENKYNGLQVYIENDRFVFDNELEDEQVIIEYVSNGMFENLNECAIRIPYNYYEVLSNWIKWKYLEGKEQAMNRILMYREEYKKEKKLLNKQTDTTSKEEIISISDFRFNRRR